MGCYSSRSFPTGSREWVIVEFIHRSGFHKLSVRKLTEVFADYPQWYLVAMQFSDIARRLDIELDLETFRENTQDLRVVKWKLFVTLVICSSEDDSAKQMAFAEYLQRSKRSLVRVLEWRAELLAKRLFDAAVRKELITFAEATAMKSKEMTSAFASVPLNSAFLIPSKNVVTDFASRNLLHIKPE